jgi:multidrug efflux pump
VDIDRDKAAPWAWALPPSTAPVHRAGLGLRQRLPNQGRLQRVVVQADAPARMQPEDILADVPNSQGQPVPLSAFASTRWITGPMQTMRYNGYPAMRIAGGAAPGYSTGEAMAEMERLAASCPRASATSGPASRARKSWPARRP